MLLRSTGDSELDAFVEFEVRYNQTRWTEVWLSCGMCVIGSVFLSNGSTFALSHAYDLLAYYSHSVGLNETGLGFILTIVGCLRLIALYINGHRKRTPIVRTIGCSFGFLFWALFFASVLKYNESSTAYSTGMVYVVFAVAELHASSRATRDAIAYLKFKQFAKRHTFNVAVPAIAS